MLMTATDATPNMEQGKSANDERATAARERGNTRPKRGITEPRLPRGVLVRVDVFQDRDGRIRTFTLERLSGRWGDERSEVATLVVKTGLDILNRFEDEERTESEELVAHPGVATQIGLRDRLSDPDLQRLYG